MLFEVLVLVSTVLNALDRPSQAELPITRSLHRDGITYFFVRTRFIGEEKRNEFALQAVTCFRVLNLTLSIVARPSETMVVIL